MVIDAPDLPASGRFADGEHRFPVRVYFEDTDLGGVVYHANYLRFMERARSDMLRVSGIDQRSAHAAGVGVYAVTAMDIRYHAPARLDDDLLVLTRVDMVKGASLVVHQRVMRDAQLLAGATVTVAFVGPDGRARRQPVEWTEIFKSVAGGN